MLPGIYVSTVNSLPVLHAAELEGRLPRLTVITTDLFPELVERIRSGIIAATMYQRPLSQGRLALEALYQFLHNGKCPSARIHVVPHVVMRSNLELFLERLPVDLEASPALAPDRTVSRRPDMTSPSPRAPLPRPRRQRRSMAP